jgi:hypothetical protein
LEKERDMPARDSVRDPKISLESGCVHRLLMLQLEDTGANVWSDFRDARELVAELEFVWDQIKNNSASSSNSSPGRGGADLSQTKRFQAPRSGSDGPMKVLSPMSQDDEDEIEAERRMDHEGEGEGEGAGEGGMYKNDEYDAPDKEKRKTKKWQRKVEAALVKMTAEMAALREQIETGRDWRVRRERSIGAWLGWLIWVTLRHFLLDAVLLGLLLVWMRKRKDRRLEDLVRQAVRIGREYVRKLLPPR